MKKVIYVAVILILLIPNIAWAVGSIECDSKQVKVGDTMAALIVACGKPLYSTVQKHTETTTSYSGDTTIVEYTTEIWSYQIGSKKWAYMITFHNGIIIEIERSR